MTKKIFYLGFLISLLTLEVHLKAMDHAPKPSYNQEASECLTNLFEDTATAIFPLHARDKLVKALLLKEFIQKQSPEKITLIPTISCNELLKKPREISGYYKRLRSLGEKEHKKERDEFIKVNLESKIPEITASLLHQNADPNGTRTPTLNSAIYLNNLQLARILLAHPHIDLHKTVGLHDNPVETALRVGSIEILLKFLQHPTFNFQTEKEPLLEKCSKAYERLLDEFECGGAHPQKTKLAFRLLLTYAAPIDFENDDIKRALPRAYPNPLLYAIVTGDKESVEKELTDIPLAQDLVDADNISALTYASGQGHSALVNLLLKQPCYIANPKPLKKAFTPVKYILRRIIYQHQHMQDKTEVPLGADPDYQRYNHIHHALIAALKQPFETLKQTMQDNYKRSSFEHIPSDMWSLVGTKFYGPKLCAYLYGSSST